MCPIEARPLHPGDTIIASGIFRVEETKEPLVIKGTAEVSVYSEDNGSKSTPQSSAIVVGTFFDGGYVLGKEEGAEWIRIRNLQEIVRGDVVYQGVLEQGKRPNISFNLP